MRVGGFGDVEGVDVDAVEVVVEGAVEAAEGKEESADEGGRVAASGGWAGLAGEESPVVGIWIKIMKFIKIIRVSSSKDKHSFIIHTRRMSPSS